MFLCIGLRVKPFFLYCTPPTSSTFSTGNSVRADSFSSFKSSDVPRTCYGVSSLSPRCLVLADERLAGQPGNPRSTCKFTKIDFARFTWNTFSPCRYFSRFVPGYFISTAVRGNNEDTEVLHLGVYRRSTSPRQDAYTDFCRVVGPRCQ